MKKILSAIALVGLLASVLSCGRRPLRPDQWQRNLLYAEIVKREDLRQIGSDGFFRHHLGDPADPQVQQWCAVALGRIGDPRALPWLYAALRSAHKEVRAAAAFGIGLAENRDLLRSEGRTIHDRTIRELGILLDDPALAVRAAAVEALGKAGAPAEALAIVRCLDRIPFDGSPAHGRFLESAITALMRLRNTAARPALERLAALHDPEIQWRVANAFYRMRDRDARPALERLLASAHPDVKAHAARALGVCGGPATAALLRPLLMPGNPLPVRVSALQALVSLKDPAASAAVREAVSSQPAGEATPDQLDQLNFTVQAAAALGNLGSAENAGLLASLVRMQRAVADSAVVALAKTLRHDPDRFFAVLPQSRAARPWSARAWAGALAEVGGARAQDELKRMLVLAAQDQTGRREQLAIPAILPALARLNPPDMDSILAAYFASHDGVVLRSALAAYTPAPGAAAAWKPILQMYANLAGSTDVETKVALLDRLDPWLEVAEIQSFLRSALQDRERNARIAAARLLRRAGAAEISPDPGPASTAATDQICTLAATARQERTIAVIETDRGIMEFALFRQEAPLTVANFIALANRGFYNGLSFMRVVPYFVIQGGDPRNDQEGGPGYAIRCEINPRRFERGSLGMALSGKDTGGSQFFVTLSPQPHLDGGYTCFGRIISGLPVAEHIVAGDRIRRVRIREEKTILDFRNF